MCKNSDSYDHRTITILSAHLILSILFFFWYLVLLNRLPSASLVKNDVNRAYSPGGPWASSGPPINSDWPICGSKIPLFKITIMNTYCNFSSSIPVVGVLNDQFSTNAPCALSLLNYFDPLLPVFVTSQHEIRLITKALWFKSKQQA